MNALERIIIMNPLLSLILYGASVTCAPPLCMQECASRWASIFPTSSAYHWVGQFCDLCFLILHFLGMHSASHRERERGQNSQVPFSPSLTVSTLLSHVIFRLFNTALQSPQSRLLRWQRSMTVESHYFTSYTGNIFFSWSNEILLHVRENQHQQPVSFNKT